MQELEQRAGKNKLLKLPAKILPHGKNSKGSSRHKLKKDIHMEHISTLENSSSLVSITLKENKLKKDGTYYATVTRNKASFRNILSEIAEENKGIDPFILQYCAILMQKKILKLLEQGKAVNILDLGTMYIAMEVSAKSKTEVPQNGKFKVRFSPTKLTSSSLQNLSIDKIVYNDKSPEIDSVADISTEEENVLSLGAPAKITGANLKLGSEESGIYFAAVDSDENLEDSSAWTKVDDSKVFRNKPAELNFFVPQTLDSSKAYRIVIKTNYISASVTRKEFLESVSSAVKIKE